MIMICTNTPVPTIAEIKQALLTSLENDLRGRLPNINPLMTLRSKIYGAYRNAELEMQQIAQEIAALQRFTSLSALIKPILKFLKLANIDDFLPKIPGTVLTILDLLALSPDALYRMALRQLPYRKYINRAIEQVQSVQLTILEYENMILAAAYEVIGLATKALRILGLEIPGMDDLLDVAAALASGVRGAAGRLYHNLEVEAVEAAKELLAEAYSAPLRAMVDFCKDTLGKFIDFEFPTICIPIPLT